MMFVFFGGDNDFIKSDYEDVAGQEVEPPYAMPWYPNELAWHMNFSRAALRKMPVLTALHEFIKRENDAGSISRQEAVSMVPPLFLDVQPHHIVRSSHPLVTF
jgi:16S rRNA C967 or C1407 C5-methylase (RsmB/RsmF family)